MDQKLPSTELLQMLEKDLQEKITRAENRWETLRSQSTAARTSFNEKLAVLAAGSVAVLATAATTLYNKPLLSKSANSLVLEAIAFAALSLFVSLSLCVFNSFAESYALEKESEMQRNEAQILQRVRQANQGFSAGATDGNVFSGSDKLYERISRLRRNQRRLGYAAFTLFAIGYGQIVWLTIEIAKNSH
jgi:hypothetical protein